MNLTLHVWRQKNATDKGRMTTYAAKGVNPEMSFLEMLDVLNEELTVKGEDPIAFDHDCREGICGSCGFMINGVAHGPLPKTTVCQLHMRHFDRPGRRCRCRRPWRTTWRIRRSGTSARRRWAVPPNGPSPSMPVNICWNMELRNTASKSCAAARALALLAADSLPAVDAEPGGCRRARRRRRAGGRSGAITSPRCRPGSRRPP